MIKKTNIHSKGKTDLDRQAYQGIREMLFYNEIIPGQKIKYNDLANRLEVSVTPVIHALKWLELKGIVRHETNKGYYINAVSLEEFQEIYHLRLLLETAVVPEIIKHVDEKCINRLENSLEEWMKAVEEDNVYGRLMLDMNFHLTLTSIAQRRLQLKMLQDLFDLLLLKYSRNLVFLTIMDTSQQEHFGILQNVKDKSVSSLEKALSNHLNNVRDYVSTHYKRMFVTKREPLLDWQAF